jgi:hypothetical protein
MKNYFRPFVILFLCLLFVSFSNVSAGPPDNLISINFGNTISSVENTGAILACQNWNTLYKGNSAYLLNNNNEQSSCYLKTNAIGSTSSEFNYSDFSISRSSLSTHKENIHLAFYGIPYDSYRIYIYFNQFHKSKIVPVVINGQLYELPQVMSDEYSGYCIVEANITDQIDLSFNNEINISAIQIAPNNESESLGLISESNNNSFIYPTYVKESITIDMNGFATGQYIVEVFDNTGKIVKNFTLSKTSSSKVYKLQLNNLSSGIYTVSILGNQSRTSEQILIK